MDFFEELKQRAWEKAQYEEFAIDGVVATVEALKEMAVGEPRRGTLRHRSWYQNTGLSTDIDISKNILCWDIQKHGTDGEEVVVAVFRVCLEEIGEPDQRREETP